MPEVLLSIKLFRAFSPLSLRQTER